MKVTGLVARGKEGKKARRLVGKWKEGKVGTASRPEGKFGDLTRLWARGPANFPMLLFASRRMFFGGPIGTPWYMEGYKYISPK